MITFSAPLIVATLDWNNLGSNLLMFAIFGLAGIFMAILGYKVFDSFTPGNLHSEIIEKKNVAAALLAGSVIIGVSIVLAAAMS